MTENVAVIILNWNGSEDTVACLDSVNALRRPPGVIVVVDNGSTDTSVEVISRWAEAQKSHGTVSFARLGAQEVHHPGAIPDETESAASRRSLALIRSDENLGYARGNNLGIGLVLQAFPDVTHVLILNNDTLLQPDSVEEMLGQFLDHSVGLVGPRVVDYHDGSEWQWPVRSRLDFLTMVVVFSALNRLLRRTRLYRSRFYMEAHAGDVYAVPGSCMLFDRRALADIGGFDPATFLYWEEFIVAERLRKLGYRTRYAPGAVVAHKLGASTRKLGSQRFVENVRSERYFLSRYSDLTRWQILIVQALKIAGYTARSLASPDYRANVPKLIRALGASDRSARLP